MRARLPDGAALAYEESGSGIPLLFVHGWPHARTLWAGQLGGLPTYARCIAPDLRGFGDSTVRPPFTIDQYADDLVALLDALGIDRAVVCGLSMGGYVAFSLLRRHRARVRGLVLAATRATADDGATREKRTRLIEFIEARGMAALADQQLPLMLGRATRETRPEVGETMRRMMAAAPVEGTIGALRAMKERPDSTALLPTIDVPTLVVGGAEDELVPPDAMRAMAAAIPGSRFELIAGAGHVCALERPAAFDQLLVELLAALRQP